MEILPKASGVKHVSFLFPLPNSRSDNTLFSFCLLSSQPQRSPLLLIFFNAGNKNFAKQTVFDAHLKGGKHQKAAARLASNPTTSNPNPNSESSKTTSTDEKTKKLNRIKNLASLENLISITSQELLPVRNETRSNVERKSALTEKERIAEAEAVEENRNGLNGDALTQEQLEGNDDDEKIYNPLKLPLGWDGKPIPYWLYKLHGLGVEFKCEICSDYVYQGR